MTNGDMFTHDDLIKRHLNGTAHEIAEWVLRAIIGFCKQNPLADVERILVEVVDKPYPVSEDPMDRTYDLSAKETISVSFTLGFIAGVLRDRTMGDTYEAVYRLLESFHYHYQFQYGLEPSDDENDVPCFVVKVPSDKTKHVTITVPKLQSS